MEEELQFTDLTILQANGEYSEVCKIMKDETIKSKIVSKKNNWMLRSRVIILSPFGSAVLLCHFYDNGKVYIADYLPSMKDIHTTDIRYLTHWCNEKGWKIPEPLQSIIQSWPDFWRKEWETYIIDSEYFEKKHGPRKDIKFDDDEDDGDEDGDSE